MVVRTQRLAAGSRFGPAPDGVSIVTDTTMMEGSLPPPLLQAEAMGRLLAHGRRPVAATATSGAHALTVDAWGVLRDCAIDPFDTAGHATQVLARLHAAAIDGLAMRLRAPRPIEPAAWPGGDAELLLRFDDRKLFPSALERVGAGAWDVPDAAYAEVLPRVCGTGTSGPARVTLRPGCALDSIALRGPLDEEDPAPHVMAAARSAAGNAVTKARSLLADGILEPSWGLTTLLLTNPYDNPLPEDQQP